MPIANHEVILFTGQSGIKISDSLKKFIESKQKEFDRNSINTKIHYYKLETEIVSLYEGRNISPSENKDKEVWRLILNEPYSKIQELWDLALQNIHQKIMVESGNNATSLFLISFHSIFYHKKTNEYLSFINIDLLANLNPTKIITLIDDIYDIHSRLQMPKEMFYRNYQANKVDLVLDLFLIQDWRAKEIMMSRFINSQLKYKSIQNSFFVLAVKHPYDTLDNLIFKKPVVYFSHPISEVRRLEKNGDTSTANEVRLQMDDFSKKIIEKFATFLPTTIDEYRIQSIDKKITGRRKLNYNLKQRKPITSILNYVSVLGPRWESEKYSSPHNIFFETVTVDSINDLWSENLPQKRDANLSNLLKALKSRISGQVTVRDYILVEQSDILVVFRPIYNGNLSGGVKEENDYYNMLSKVEAFQKKGRDRVYIYCPKKDVLKLIENSFIKQLENCIQIQKVFKTKTDLPKLPANFAEKVFIIINSAQEKERIDEENLISIFDDTLLNHFKIEFDLSVISRVYGFLKISSPLPSEQTPLGGSQEKNQRQIIQTAMVKDFLESITPFFTYKKSRMEIIEHDTLENMKTFVDSIQ